jgi:hypothetical protein
MLPKKGIVFPNAGDLGPYSRAIAYALKRELGSTHQATKIVMAWTGAAERTVKNWLGGQSGPSGRHLIELMRNSQGVLQVVLVLAGRRRTASLQHLADVRSQLIDTVESIDRLMQEQPDQ